MQSVRPLEYGTERQCAVLAELKAESMGGTAPVETRFLLIEQPGAWGRKALTQSALDPDVAADLQARADRAHVRVLLIRRPGRSAPGTSLVWGIADCLETPGVVRWGTYTTAQDLLNLDIGASAAELPGDPSAAAVYLVCTHGKRDVCCSVRGRPMAQALEAVRPGQVWEASHLGGHRFAANVLILPTGQLYGRVPSASALELVLAVESGAVLAHLLRGQCGYSAPAQAAVAYAHQNLSVSEIDAITVVSETQAPGGETMVELRTPHGDARILVAAEQIKTRASCRDEHDEPATAHRVLTMAMSI
jgi:hypothetical protein